MKPLFVLLLSAGLTLAQESKPAAAAAEQAKPAEKTEEAKPAAKEAAAESPNPSPERNVSFQLDFGNRFVQTVGGDLNTYRSVVNLGSGPKLMGLEANITDPKHRIFDRLNIGAHNWGGDPYNTLRVDMERTKMYRFTGDYRNIQYFNFLPSFANPGAPQTLLNQRSYDAQRRYSNAELEILPGNWIVPYFAWMRDEGTGRGITPYVANSNEYPVPTLLDDRTNLFRGGVRLEMGKWHATLEQGGGTYGDNQRIYDSLRNTGNRTTPVLGQNLVLTDLLGTYDVKGRNIFTKGLLTAAPADWAHLYASFIYSRPTSDVTYSDRGSGLFLAGVGRFFNTFQTLLGSEAKMPRTSGSAAAELRPTKWLRVLESIWTDRFHNASSALLAEQFLTGTTVGDARNLFTAERTVVNYNRQQLEAFVDVIPKVTLRGGHRYVFGNAVTPPSLLSNGLPESGDIRQQVGLAGITVRPTSKVSANLDFEGSAGDKSYFRTSLHNYKQVRARVQTQLLTNLRFSGNFYFLDNQNPNTRVSPTFRSFTDYSFRNYAITGALNWLPQGGKYFSFLTEYTRSVLRSDVGYLEPQALLPVTSRYRDNGHVVTSLLDVRPRGNGPHMPYLSFGGSLFRSGGTRPTNYYQPVGRLALPLSTMVEAYGEWRWYGMTQPLFLYEGFRTHTGVIGLRISR